jgi:crossover junction endodeoxyribonuclease RusA
VTLEIELPFEFVVFGVPISLQASGSSRGAWKAKVAATARENAPAGYWATADQLSVTIIYFSLGPSTIDTDNMVKPILDALSGIIWMNDNQVAEVIARKTDRSSLASFTNPPPDIAAAMTTEEPFVYVRVRRMGRHEELPK